MSDDRPGGLKLHPTGLNLAELDLVGGEGFWDEVGRFAAASRLGDELDELMDGRSVPRVWVFCDAADQGPTAAAAALTTARLLADRGQAVVLLDADEQRRDLTRWIGRTEEEGWIDMVRYGASLHVASDALPSRGRRGSVLGTGSFTPTGVTGTEVADLLARLRRQADDLIIVAPAGAAARAWCAAADVRILAWDRLAREEDATSELIADLAGEGIVLDAVVGFGVEEHAAIASRLQPAAGDDDGAVVPPAPPAPPPAPVAAGEEPASPDPSVLTRRPRRSSGIFWAVAAMAAVALVVLGWFYFRTRQAAEVPAPIVAAERGDVLPSAGEPATPPAEAETEVPPPVDEPATPPAEAEAEVPPPADAPQTEPEPEPEPEPEATPQTPGFDLAPYRKPVGEDGWALWFSSLPDTVEARQEVRRLEELGLRAAYRPEEIEGKGTWYRVYVGSFPSKAAARAAAPLLNEHLKHDWAMPRRF